MHYLGLDIGTTGAKALLVDKAGKRLGMGYAGYRLISDGDNIEQRADDWTLCGAAAVRQALEGNDPSMVAAVALSTQGASMLALDAENRPIGNALTWMDGRAKKEANELAEKLGEDYLYRRTGWRVNASLDAAKIMYMKRSDFYGDAVCFLSTLEYMNLFLTGNPVCDPTNASIRQVYDIHKGDYDDEILDAIGVSRAELPEILPAAAPVGHITKAAAAATGLREGTPVYNGAHDQTCASIGAAAVNKGDILLSAGTTWVILGIDEKPLFTDTWIAPAAHPIPGLYSAVASLVGSGMSLQWYRDAFLDVGFDEVNRQVRSRTDKARDLFFYPFLSGAFYPRWAPEARGVFTGIALEHDKYDFARAIMEATAFGVRLALEDFSSNGFDLSALRIMGGAAKSEIWCELIAAAIGRPAVISGETEACALGAAIIAAAGDGAYPSLRDAVEAMTAAPRGVFPNTELTNHLEDKFSKYTRMWDCIRQYYS